MQTGRGKSEMAEALIFHKWSIRILSYMENKVFPVLSPIQPKPKGEKNPPNPQLWNKVKCLIGFLT